MGGATHRIKKQPPLTATFKQPFPVNSNHGLHHPHNHLKNYLEGSIWIMNAFMLGSARTAPPWGGPKRCPEETPLCVKGFINAWNTRADVPGDSEWRQPPCPGGLFQLAPLWGTQPETPLPQRSKPAFLSGAGHQALSPTAR